LQWRRNVDEAEERLGRETLKSCHGMLSVHVGEPRTAEKFRVIRLQVQRRALSNLPELLPDAQAAAQARRPRCRHPLLRHGEFALETHAAEIAVAIRDFLH